VRHFWSVRRLLAAVEHFPDPQMAGHHWGAHPVLRQSTATGHQQLPKEVRVKNTKKIVFLKIFFPILDRSRNEKHPPLADG